MRISAAVIAIFASAAFTAGAELSLCGTEELLPIGFTEEELTRAGEIGTYLERSDPPPSGVRNPAEFEPSTGVMVRWPLGVPYDFLIDVSNSGELWVIVSSSQHASAQSSLTSAGVNMDNTDFIVAPNNSIWVRDYGPWFITLPDGTQGIFNYSYNRPRPLDDLIPQVIGDQWGIPVYTSSIVHTGGNYMSGGLGESMSQDEVYDDNGNQVAWVHDQMQEYLGVSEYRVYDDPQSSYINHIDCWAKMLSPDRVMVLQVPPSHGDYAALEAAADLIAETDCQYGYPWNVYRVYSSGTEGYVNGLLHNDTYYMPVWNTGNDSAAELAFNEAIPGYTITPVYYSSFENTDALHCRSRNVIDRYMLEVLHTPVAPEQSGFPVEITAFIRPNPANTLVSAGIYYRVNSGSFSQVTMTPAGSGNYTGAIPGQSNGDFVEYYIRAEDSSGRVSAHPQYAPGTWFNGYTVNSTGVEGQGSSSPAVPGMVSGNPFRNSMVFAGEPETVFSVFDSAGRLVHSGGADASGLMEWTPGGDVSDGVYYVRFNNGGSVSAARAVLIR